MNHKVSIRTVRLLCVVAAVLLLVSVAFAAVGNMKQIPSGQKARVKGKINARSGDLVYVTDVKDGSTVAINVTDNTQVERKKSKYVFFRKSDMDVTAMVPGLTIEAEASAMPKANSMLPKSRFTPTRLPLKSRKSSRS